ncbi:IS1634 family transposase [Sporolactobacillus nakayamae]|uniref:Transposase, IS4 family n=1 Tax=Sporolactobacillus nakayamae TaxID=269670 RepID=A0A1I2WKK4_9BACL|nr:IS1634 family transposase [Sporolactobacillus nakayamae]SFH00886.1 transposase, IS4 family [Sporolactobacillus nakayamae]
MSLVHLKNKKNGITYVYESEGYWDKEKKQTRNRRKCIGKLDPVTGKFIPSKKYTDGLKEIINQKEKKRGPVASTTYQRRFYGATYLFDAIGAKLGLTDDLSQCFPESYQQILSLAYYLVLEDRNPMSRFPRWAKTHVHPYGKNLSSQRSSELFGSITENAKHHFFLLQSKRRVREEYLAYDTTSVSSYSKVLKQVKYGKNKDHDPLPQINLALLYGETSGLPVAYRKLPGNIADVKTIRTLLADVDFLKQKKVKIVMDRGFYSEKNINAFYQDHVKFLIGVRTSLKFVRKTLDDVRQKMITRAHYDSGCNLYYESFLTDWDYSEVKKRTGEIMTDKKRLYLHLYYNDQKATDDKMTFNKLLDRLEEELQSGRRNPEHEKLYARYYEWKETPIRGISLTPKVEAIAKAEKDFGYFALISNGIKDPIEAVEIYRTKDLIEKAFGNLKERLNLRRTSVSSEENLEGKLFIQFIALFYLSYIKKAMSDHQLFKKYTIQELLDELDVVEQYWQPGGHKHIGELTKKQMDLYQFLGVDPPALV